jgi:hypothetical protein
MNLLMKMSACCVLAMSAVGPDPLLAASSHVLANDKIRVTISEAGALNSVENLLAAETYSFRSDTFTLDTDRGLFSNSNAQPARVVSGRERLVFHYQFGDGAPEGAGAIRADLIYTLAGSNGFFRRALSVSNAAPLRVKRLVLGATTFSTPAQETLHYVTFIAAPTVEFIRHEKGGMFTGIENPIFSANLSVEGVSLSFEPGLILKSGEGYASEPQFMGVYKRSGVMIEDSGRDFRYNANASGYKPLDRKSHGHFADQGGYKGWRRCIELMARLKSANPGLFIQGFYGTKNFGLWGLKHVDQHEVLNEQSIIVSTRHHQISDDRQNADGLRFQNNWSMRFRFTPAVMGHSLTHRVSEGVFDPELIKAWDYYGWQYGVMSSLAIAGSLMPTILPYEVDLVPGFVEFYKKWQRWAKDTFNPQARRCWSARRAT